LMHLAGIGTFAELRERPQRTVILLFFI